MKTPAPKPDSGFGQAYAQAQLRVRAHPLRRRVRGFYLRRLVRLACPPGTAPGPCIDYGCGAGALLALLPPGSLGLELNPHLIQALRQEGLQVLPVHGQAEDFDLLAVPTDRAYTALVISHVLEHLGDPAAALQRLLAAAHRLGLQRLVIVVPGAAGFASDATHRCFIDGDHVAQHFPTHAHGFVRRPPAWFPGPWAWIGRWFVYHEMSVVYESTTPVAGA
jgi:SAM-dependent methyltransferase